LPLTAGYEDLDLICDGLFQLPNGTDINDRKPRRRVTLDLLDAKRWVAQLSLLYTLGLRP